MRAEVLQEYVAAVIQPQTLALTGAGVSLSTLNGVRRDKGGTSLGRRAWGNSGAGVLRGPGAAWGRGWAPPDERGIDASEVGWSPTGAAGKGGEGKGLGLN